MDTGAWWATVHGAAKSQTHLGTQLAMNNTVLGVGVVLQIIKATGKRSSVGREMNVL